MIDVAPYIEIFVCKPGKRMPVPRLVTYGILYLDDCLDDDQLRAFVGNFDRSGERHGWRDDEGSRRLISPKSVMPRFLVGETFREPQSLHAVPFGAEANWILRHYDQPERLRVVQIPFKGNNLCHERDEAYFRRMEACFLEAASDFGLVVAHDMRATALNIAQYMNRPDGPINLGNRMRQLMQAPRD